MLSLEIIVLLGSALALLTVGMVRTQLRQRRLPEDRWEGRSTRA